MTKKEWCFCLDCGDSQAFENVLDILVKGWILVSNPYCIGGYCPNCAEKHFRLHKKNKTIENNGLSAEERKIIKQYRDLPAQLQKLVRQQLDVYSSAEVLPKNGKKV